jgi:hypothetical protein
VEKLPNTIDLETGKEFNNVVLKHGNNEDELIEVIHEMPISVTGLSAIGLMRTCKKIEDEVAQVFYGGNGFVFDARTAAMINHKNWTEEDRKEFEALRYRVRLSLFTPSKPPDLAVLTCCIDSWSRKRRRTFPNSKSD